jgi:type IV secretory pathway VirB9-like protein
MKTLLFALVCASVSLSVAAADRPAWAPGEPQPDGVRTVMATPETVIPLSFKLRISTMVFLPEHEEIVFDDCGDRDFWVITVNHHMVSIKPAKPGGETNLNLITKTGAVYSFLLKEGGKGTPDLKVFVTVPEDRAPPVRKFYTTVEYEAASLRVEGLQTEMAELRARLKEVEAKAAEVKPQAPTAAPATSRLHFDYKPVKDEKPFHVKAVFHDGTFTYIQTTATEKFTIYETKDGKPSLLQFQVENGTYIIPKVIEDAYLALGTARFPIALKSGAGN